MDLQGKIVAVTGASGMIGVYICRSLLAAGARVVGVVRNPEKAAFLAKEGVEFRKADLADPEALKKAFTGCDAVVSNAAMYVVAKSMHAWAEHEKANLEGTSNVMEAAHAAGVNRVVHISTFGIYKWSIFHALTENSTQLNGAKRQGGPYRATKQVSEEMAWDIAKKNGTQLTTLRPSAVFGARDYNTLKPIYKVLKMPVVPIPNVSFPIVYAGDVADAVVGALKNDVSVNQAYNVGGADRKVGEFFKAVAEVLPNKPKIVPIPLPITIGLDNSKAEREIGFRNRPFSESMREVAKEELV